MSILIKTKRKIVLIMLLGLTSYIQIAWRYPLAQVTPASDECKIHHRSQLDSKCKINMPIITPSQYDTFNTKNPDRNIITMLYGATYTNQRDYRSGGSPGIDIATAKGTPVYSIGDGVIIYVGDGKGGDGNRISISHLDHGKKIYSHYSHLENIEVSKGQKVKAGDRIGTVGNSGRTIGKYGNHLDFQIDIKETYSKMFGYYGCKDGYVGAINKGACRDMMTEYTIDPLKFLADRKATLPIISSPSVSVETNTDPVLQTPKSVQVDKVSVSQTQSFSETPSSQSYTGSNSPLISKTINGITYHIDGLYQTTVVGLKQKLTVTISAHDEQGKMLVGILPDTIDIMTSNRNITNTIETINYLDQKALWILTGKKIGKTILRITVGDSILANVTVIVQ